MCSSRRGGVPTPEKKDHPVTWVSWRDAIVSIQKKLDK